MTRSVLSGIHLVGQEKLKTWSSSAKRAKVRWLLLLTLLNNPSLLGSRKPLRRPASESQRNGTLGHAPTNANAAVATEANGKDGGKAPETPPPV